MRRETACRIAVASLLFVSGCGGGDSPMQPSVPATTASPAAAAPQTEPSPGVELVNTVDVLAGEELVGASAPLVAGTVEVNGQRPYAFSDGKVGLPKLSSNAIVRISADGFLDRVATFGELPVNGPHYLWPERPWFSWAFTEAMAYPGFWGPRMARPTRDVLLRTHIEDEESLRAHGLAVAKLNNLNGSRRKWSYTMNPQDVYGVVYHVSVDPRIGRLGFLGYASVKFRRGVAITGAILYASPKIARHFGIVLHELGHGCGLGHWSGDGGSFMCPTFGCLTSPTVADTLVMRIMQEREPGNQLDDTSPSVTTLSRTTRGEDGEVEIEYFCF